MVEFGLPERTLMELREYFSKQDNIEKVLIYGSRAKGTYHNGSDIDFAIIGKNINSAKISGELDDLPTPYSFDVLDYNSINHEGMLKSIQNDGKVFYTRD